MAINHTPPGDKKRPSPESAPDPSFLAASPAFLTTSRAPWNGQVSKNVMTVPYPPTPPSPPPPQASAPECVITGSDTHTSPHLTRSLVVSCPAPEEEAVAEPHKRKARAPTDVTKDGHDDVHGSKKISTGPKKTKTGSQVLMLYLQILPSSQQDGREPVDLEYVCFIRIHSNARATQICEHGRRKRQCKDCVGSQVLFL